jgi:hypothetical protein
MYSNNKEYRELLRLFFNMDISNIKSEIKHCNYDDETYDELLFDESAVNSSMTNIIEKTKGNLLFDELYDLASAKMFSTNKETGLCILLSYDFFSDFYHLWNSYIENPNIFSKTNDYYILLQNRLMKK